MQTKYFDLFNPLFDKLNVTFVDGDKYKLAVVLIELISKERSIINNEIKLAFINLSSVDYAHKYDELTSDRQLLDKFHKKAFEIRNKILDQNS